MNNIKRIGYGSYGYEIVCQNHKQGVRLGGPGGAIVVPIVYDTVRYFGHDLYEVRLGKEFGLFSARSGGLVASIQYTTFNYARGGNFVGLAGKHHLATLDTDRHGVIVEMEYDEVETVKSDNQHYIVRKDGKYGLVFYSLPTQPRIPLNYDSIRPITWGGENRFSTVYLVRQGQKYGLMEGHTSEFCLGTGGWDKNRFSDDGLVYDEIRHIENGLFLMRQGTKYGVFNLYACLIYGDGVAYDEVRRTGKKQYLMRRNTAWRVLTPNNLTHPFSPPFDELRKVGDGTFWFRKGNQTGTYDPEGGIDPDHN